MSDSGKSWKDLLYGDPMNRGHLFRDYAISMVSATQLKPTSTGIPEMMQPMQPLLEDDKNRKDRVRKCYANHSPEKTNPWEMAAHLDKSLGPLSDTGRETVALIEEKNKHFHSLIPESLKELFIDPPDGGWWFMYLASYQNVVAAESNENDELCCFFLKIAETEISLMLERNSNMVKAAESALRSPHEVSANSETDETIDRLLLWAALDELQLCTWHENTKEKDKPAIDLVSLEHCVPKAPDGEKIITSTNQFLNHICETNIIRKRWEIADALGIDGAEVNRLRKHKKLLTEKHLYEYYAMDVRNPFIFQTHRHINIWTQHQLKLESKLLSPLKIVERFNLYEQTKLSLNKLYENFKNTGEIT